jgi:hypothetical protein
MPDLVMQDLDNFLDGKRLVIPISGKKYVIEEATGETFLRLQRYGAALNEADTPNHPSAAEFDGLTQNDLAELCLGRKNLEAMAKNNVRGSAIERATLAAFFWHIGQTSAVVTAAFEGLGKARKATPRKASPRKKTAPTTRSAAASTTQRRESGTGTSTRRSS